MFNGAVTLSQFSKGVIVAATHAPAPVFVYAAIPSVTGEPAALYSVKLTTVRRQMMLTAEPTMELKCSLLYREEGIEGNRQEIGESSRHPLKS